MIRIVKRQSNSGVVFARRILQKCIIGALLISFAWSNIFSFTRALHAFSPSTNIELSSILLLHDNDETTYNVTTSTTSRDDDTSRAATLPKLNLDWGNLQVLSPLGQQHQGNCSLRSQSQFRFRNRYGLGSDLHLWSMALCNAVELGTRVITQHPVDRPWIYWDAAACGNYTPNKSVLECYFGHAEPACPTPSQTNLDENKNSSNYSTAAPPQLPKLYKNKGRIWMACPTLRQEYSDHDLYAAAMEVLFTGVTPIIVQEAKRQVQRVFGNDNGIPPNLITVHVRWGDKRQEMALVNINTYIQAVNKLSYALEPDRAPNATIHVYLATEDPAAVQAFMSNAPPHFKIYIEDYYHQFAAHRITDYNGNPKMNRALQGAPGRVAIASLLVALHATGYVVTTASNWSRVLDELRRSILDARCNNCTRMIDLRPMPGNRPENVQSWAHYFRYLAK